MIEKDEEEETKMYSTTADEKDVDTEKQTITDKHSTSVDKTLLADMDDKNKRGRPRVRSNDKERKARSVSRQILDLASQLPPLPPNSNQCEVFMNFLDEAENVLKRKELASSPEGVMPTPKAAKLQGVSNSNGKECG